MTAPSTTLVEAISLGRSGQVVFFSSAWTSWRYLESFWIDPSFFAGAGLAGPAIFTPSFRAGEVVPFLSAGLVVMIVLMRGYGKILTEESTASPLRAVYVRTALAG